MTVTSDILARDTALSIMRHKKYNWFDVADLPGITFPEGMETVVGELLCSLVKVVQPKMILETGTRCGISTRYLIHGKTDECVLHTVERDPYCRDYANKKIQDQRAVNVICHCKDSQDLIRELILASPSESLGFVLLDSEPCYRYREMELLVNSDILARGAIIAIHDLPNVDCAPFLPDVPWIKAMILTETLTVFGFQDTDTGLTIFQYKPKLWNARA